MAMSVATPPLLSWNETSSRRGKLEQTSQLRTRIVSGLPSVSSSWEKHRVQSRITIVRERQKRRDLKEFF